MPAPVPYNGNQSRLEYYALNGNVGVNGGLGRPVLITQTTLLYGSSFKNPVITKNVNDQYGPTHTNAIHDSATPNRGKGTGGGIVNGNFSVITNYNGGDDYDINGGNTSVGNSLAGTGIGRSSSLSNNLAVWGYSPLDSAGAVTNVNNYKVPNMSANVGQVII